MSVLTRIRAEWGAGVAVAAVTAALITPPQKPAAAEPDALPVGLQYVPPDAAVFGHVEFAPVWKSALGDTFRKLKIPGVDVGLKELTLLTGLTLDDITSATVYLPELKAPQDTERVGFVVTTGKKYDRDAIAKALAAGPVARDAKFENKGNVIRITAKAGMKTLFADLSDDRRLVFGVNLKDEPKANPKGTDGPHAATFKQAGAAVLAGVNFDNLPDEFRRAEDNLPPQMRAFLPIAKSETISLVGKLDGKALTLSVAVRSPNKQTAADVEKSLDILRGLAKLGLDEGAKEVDLAEKAGDDMAAFRPLLKAAGDVLKTAKLELADRTATATVTVPTNLPYGPFVELVTGVKKSVNAEDQNNLKQMGLAIHNYADTFNALPPSYLVDKKGKPTLSWRVILLPYIEQDQLYKKFKLDEPWDSEHNMKVYKDHPIPPVFLFPGDKAEDKKTRYRVFTGNGAGWDATGALKFANVTDGLSNTVAVATAATAVPWTKPEELEFDPEKEVAKLLHFRGDRCNVAFFDGSVRALTKKNSEVTLKAIITRAGGEVFDLDK